MNERMCYYERLLARALVDFTLRMTVLRLFRQAAGVSPTLVESLMGFATFHKVLMQGAEVQRNVATHCVSSDQQHELDKSKLVVSVEVEPSLDAPSI